VSGAVLVVMTEPGSANAAGPVARELVRRGVALDVYAAPTAEGALRVWGLDPKPADALPQEFDPRWACGLLGSSGAPCAEWAAVALLHRAGRAALTVIDAPTGLAPRFANPQRLPDLLALPDQAAWDAALVARIPAERLRLTGSPYLEHLAELPVPVEREEARRRMDIVPGSFAVLFALEPAVGDGEWEGVDAPDAPHIADALEMTAEALAGMGRPGILLVKPHPLQRPGQAEAWVAALSLAHPQVPVRLLRGLDGRSAAGGADLAVSVSSNLLLEAALLGVPTLSVGDGGWQDRCLAVSTGLSARASSPEQARTAMERAASGSAVGMTSRALQTHRGATDRVMAALDGLAPPGGA
jgi:hypothetical protein